MFTLILLISEMKNSLYLQRKCPRGEIGRHAILRGWCPMDVLVRIQSWAHFFKEIFLLKSQKKLDKLFKIKNINI